MESPSLTRTVRVQAGAGTPALLPRLANVPVHPVVRRSSSGTPPFWQREVRRCSALDPPTPEGNSRRLCMPAAPAGTGCDLAVTANPPSMEALRTHRAPAGGGDGARLHGLPAGRHYSAVRNQTGGLACAGLSAMSSGVMSTNGAAAAAFPRYRPKNRLPGGARAARRPLRPGFGRAARCAAGYEASAHTRRR